LIGSFWNEDIEGLRLPISSNLTEHLAQWLDFNRDDRRYLRQESEISACVIGGSIPLNKTVKFKESIVGSFIFVIGSSLLLGVGHIVWGIQNPFKILKESDIDPMVAASLHACWYHISIIFFLTVALLAWHLSVAPVSSEMLKLMWVLIFGCWLNYLVSLAFHRHIWKDVRFQITLILILLSFFAYGISGMEAA